MCADDLTATSCPPPWLAVTGSSPGLPAVARTCVGFSGRSRGWCRAAEGVGWLNVVYLARAWVGVVEKNNLPMTSETIPELGQCNSKTEKDMCLDA